MATTGGTWDKAVISGGIASRPFLPTADIRAYARAGWLCVHGAKGRRSKGCCPFREEQNARRDQ
jgi:hypothetical protein